LLAQQKQHHHHQQQQRQQQQQEEHQQQQQLASFSNIATVPQGMQQQQVQEANSLMLVLYDYSATSAEAASSVLSLRAGEVATLCELNAHGWCLLKTAAGQEGYFPQAYIAPAESGVYQCRLPGQDSKAESQHPPLAHHADARGGGNKSRRCFRCSITCFPSTEVKYLLS
jgi:hypothetical protein